MAANGFLAAVVLAVAAGTPALTGVQLPDHRGGSDSLAAHRGSAVVVLIVDARRLGAVRRWADDLVTNSPAVHLLTVADVNEERPVTLERVAAVLARKVPPQATVLIDMERLWAREFALDTGVPNLVVVDPAGSVVAKFRGRWSAGLAADVRKSLAAAEGAT